MLWMNLVFGFSAQGGESSSGLSHWVATWFTDDVEFQDVLEPIIRKIAHFSEYGLGGILFLGFFETFEMSNKKKLIFAVILGIIYAISDEIHQLFVDGRTGKITDVWIDSLGLVTGICFLKLILEIINNKRKKMQ